jgi:hypothetical protein
MPCRIRMGRARAEVKNERVEEYRAFPREGAERDRFAGLRRIGERYSNALARCCQCTCLGGNESPGDGDGVRRMSRMNSAA